MTRSAIFSPDRKYRYRLAIKWGSNPPVNFLMLNPSTADEVSNDPTVERCERRARQLGFGSVIITNLFAWRSTDPCQLYLPGDRVGPDNNDWIIDAATEAALVVCGWGRHGTYLGRGNFVRSILVLAEIQLYYLKLSSNTGQPWHPLYLPYSLQPTKWI